MLNPGDLGFARAAIFAQLTSPLFIPQDHPERAWLDWLGVPYKLGQLTALQPDPIELTGSALREQGILPEVVYSCLVQTWWHPGQNDWVARTRSEIIACFQPEQLDRPGWPLQLETLQRINAYRLQELTPSELLDASRPFWPGTSPEVERMEGWILLHLETFSRLQDVAQCLSPFLQGQLRSLPAGLSLEEANEILGMKLTLQPEARDL